MPVVHSVLAHCAKHNQFSLAALTPQICTEPCKRALPCCFIIIINKIVIWLVFYLDLFSADASFKKALQSFLNIDIIV